MDNRITRKRFSDFMAYEWIMIIVCILAAIVAWEFVYGIVSVKPTAGQQFKIYYDQGVVNTSDRLLDLIEKDDTLSFDVLDLDVEQLIEESNVLTTRLSIYEGDIIIADGTKDEKGVVRAKEVVDITSAYSLEELLSDSKTYLRSFLKDGIAEDGAEYNFDNLDTEKIKANFISRMDGDNRFRKEEQIEKGFQDEIDRIQKLCKDTADFEYFLKNAPEEAFFRYTRYEQRLSEDLGEYYQEVYRESYEYEKLNRPNAIYGINAGALKGGQTDPSLYFRVSGADNANNSIIMAFNFLQQQPDLQFECVSFFCTVLRECSDII